MGFGGAGRKNPGYQQQWDVYRSGGHLVGGGGIHGEAEYRAADDGELFIETGGAWAGHGRYGGSYRSRKSKTLSGFIGVAGGQPRRPRSVTRWSAVGALLGSVGLPSQNPTT